MQAKRTDQSPTGCLKDNAHAKKQEQIKSTTTIALEDIHYSGSLVSPQPTCSWHGKTDTYRIPFHDTLRSTSRDRDDNQREDACRSGQPDFVDLAREKVLIVLCGHHADTMK